MGRSPHSDNEVPVMPKMLLSIGTGAKSETFRFGFSIVGYLFRKITDTAKDEGIAQDTVTNTPGSEYFRFDVPETQGPDSKGLSKIGLAECKKKRTRSLFRKQYVRTTTQNGDSQAPPRRARTAIEEATHFARDRDRELRQKAAASNTDFDSEAFNYKTFDRIRDLTIYYIHYMERDRVSGQTGIERCASLLWETSRKRKEFTEGRWLDFRRHPDPSFRPTVRA